MMNQSKRYLIDKRTKKDILEDIKNKAKYYTPEWSIDEDNPDVGYALSMMFAKHMSENIDSLNQILDNYHIEFINMLDISPKSARPAQGIIEFSLGIDTIPGTYIPKGTKLRTDEEDPLIYETGGSVYVTRSNIVSMFLVDGEDGFIRPLKGRFEVPNLLPPKPLAEGEEPPKNLYDVDKFRLFGERESIAKNAVYFYHGSIIDTKDNPVLIRIEGNSDIKNAILSGDMEFSWYTKEGLIPFESIRLRDDDMTFELIRDTESEIDTVLLDGKRYNLIVLESKSPVRENLSVNKVSFSSKGDALPIDFATDGNTDYDKLSFAPFGEELSPYSLCFIGMDNYFGKNGALIDIEFDATYRDHLYDITAVGDDGSNNLKVIKKKPKIRAIDLPADCVVGQMSLEYFNGAGWKKLDTLSPVASMFAGQKAGKYHITFVAPEDWRESDIGAYHGRMIKLQILQADNAYLRPSMHHFPVISNCKVTYSYEDRYLIPQRIQSISGTKVFDLSKNAFSGKKFNMFASTEYFNDALYIGFSRHFEDGPINLMFEIAENFNANELKYVFEYSSSNGFRQMKVIDGTHKMTKTGIVSFLPQPDMARTTVEGKHLYWIRIVKARVGEKENKNLLPVVNKIRLNVARVVNINLLEERDIYIDSVSQEQIITLHESDILDVDIWVNELGFISGYELNKLKNERPEDCKVEYDSAGNMVSCFIHYEECNSFQLARHKRVYVLDRINGEVIFGDGIKTLTPRVLDDVAVKLSIRQSQGSRGNAEPGSISVAVGNLLYIDEINNPLKIFNGSDMEDADVVLERGSLLLQARNRLLSREDYKREIVLFTDAVKDMEIICEEKRDGSFDPLSVSCVILLNDYNIGQGSFAQIAAGIKSHLLDSCELTINSDNLHIVEPIFVDISVDIWAESINIDDSFELQTILKEDMEEYLNPVNGWKIGTLPKPSQIMMRLNVLKSKAIIKKAIIIAKYMDQDGEHEMNIKNVKITPYMICRSGSHNVHVILSD